MQRTIYLIHHTHTDVGYTELQGRITDRQVDFLRQAVRLAEADDRFRWTCETFWAVEQFMRIASSEEQTRFVQAVRSGHIGLSANYLNFSELLDYDTHRDLARRVRDFGESHGIVVSSAMTADINGHSLAYAQALCDHGVDFLFTCVHAHHGIYPLFRNQTPFYWQMPDGKRLLVWNGEHYHLGNELGLVPGAFMTRMVDDEIRWPGKEPLSIAERRVPKYLEYLDTQDYPYAFVPLMVSGLMTDNAPPAPRLTGFIDTWNAHHGDHMLLVLGTLETFFESLRSSDVEIPVYEGLWPDWWADLTAAAPVPTQIFREAQRQFALYRGLTARQMVAPQMAAQQSAAQQPAVAPTKALRSEAERARADESVGRRNVEDKLALFAEHTFGHSGTYTHPDHLLVAACSYRKSGYAAEALEGALQLLDGATAMLGAARFDGDRPLRFTVMNPHTAPYVGPVRLELDQFECGDVEVSFESGGLLPAPVEDFHAVDAETGVGLPSQAVRAPRGVQVIAWVELGAGASQTLEIRKSDARRDRPFVKVTPTRGIDGANDIAPRSARSSGGNALETPYVRIVWAPEEGIVSWLDKRSGRELLDPDRDHHAFTPVYEISPGSLRTPMGRNRKAENVRRSRGLFVGVRDAWESDLFSTVLLNYELPGVRHCALLLRGFRLHPLVEVEISIHKETGIDVESVYLSLPLKAAPDAELWIDTSVNAMRPWRDQIPGTLTDFFHVFDGFASVAPGFGVGITMPDTPLLQLGDLAVKPRLLAGAGGLDAEMMRPYAWLMNNFWETNANIDLAGFYRFRYSVFWGEAFDSPEAIFATSRYLNHGPISFRRR